MFRPSATTTKTVEKLSARSSWDSRTSATSTAGVRTWRNPPGCESWTNKERELGTRSISMFCR